MNKTYTQFTSWMPDADPTAEGILTDVENMLPTVRGYRSARAEKVAQQGPPTASSIAVAVRGLSGSSGANVAESLMLGVGVRVFLNTFNSNAWVDVAPLNGFGLARSFAQYGDIALLADEWGIYQRNMMTGGLFTAIANTPEAVYLETMQPEYVFATTTTPNEVRWSAEGNYLSWSPSAATKAGNAFLRSGGQVLTGLKRLGSSIVVYKRRRIFVGEYVGGNSIWRFLEVPADVGARNNEAIASVGGAHYFRGDDDFYMFDGTRPVSIGGGIRNYVNKIIAGFDPNGESGPTFQAEYDSDNEHIVFICEKPFGGITINDQFYYAFVYDLRTQKWGTFKTKGRKLFRRVGYGKPRGLNNLSIRNDIISVGLDAVVRGHEDTEQGFQPGYVQTGWIGDEYNSLNIKRVFPRLPYGQGFGYGLTCDYQTQESWLTQPDAPVDAPLRGAAFEMNKSRRWHRLKIKSESGMEITGLNIEYASAGKNR